jgi:hypothetical protein
VIGKGPDNVTQISGEQTINDDHNKEYATEGGGSHTGRHTHQINNDHMIFKISDNNKNDLINVHDNKSSHSSFSNSPVFHDMSEDWSHLINSVLNNDSTDINFLATADTENGGDIPVNTNSKVVVASNLTAADAMPLCGVQMNAAETCSDPTATAADPSVLSADMFASSNFVIESTDCGSKNSLVTSDQNAVTLISVQPQTDDEITEIGKSLSQALHIVSTDSTTGSSPDTVMPQTALSASTNSGTDKKKLCSTHKAGSSGHIERQDQMSKGLRARNRLHGKQAGSNARRRGQGKFSSMEKLRDGHKKKTANRRKSESRADSPQDRNHRLRRCTGNTTVTTRDKSVNLTI